MARRCGGPPLRLGSEDEARQGQGQGHDKGSLGAGKSLTDSYAGGGATVVAAVSAASGTQGCFGSAASAAFDQTQLRLRPTALRRRNRCCGCFGRIGNTRLFRFGCFGRIGGARLFRLYRDAQFPIWNAISVAVGLGLSKRNIVIAFTPCYIRGHVLLLVEQPLDCTRASTYRAGDGDAQARG